MELGVCDVLVENHRYELPSVMRVRCGGQIIGQIKYRRSILRQETKKAAIDEITVPCRPPDEADWSIAIQSIEKYLHPAINPSYATHPVHFSVAAEAFVNLYVLAEAIGLTNLQQSMEMSIYGYSFEVLTTLYHFVMQWITCGLRVAPSVHQSLILLISKDVTDKSFHFLQRLEFCEVVAKIMRSRNDLYPFVVEWMINVYEEYYLSQTKSLFNFELRDILARVTVDNSKSAFAKWLYSTFFQCDLSLIEPYAVDFQVGPHFPISIEQGKWLSEKKGQIITDQSVESFSLEEIESLVTCFSSNPEMCDYIAKRFIERGETLKNAVTLKKIVGFLSLDVLANLIHDNPPAFQMKFILKWYKTHEGPHDYDVFFSLFGKDPETGYYLLKILNFDANLGERVCETLKESSVITGVFTWMLSNVRTFAMSEPVLQQIRSYFHFEETELDTFVRFLTKFEINSFNETMLVPVSEVSYWSTIELLVQSKRSVSQDLFRSLCEAVAHDFSSLSYSQLLFLVQIIDFNSISEFSVNRGFNEDGYFFLASISPQPNWDVINYNSLSCRMASNFLLMENWKFQFPEESDSFCHNIDFTKCQFDEEKWATPGPIGKIEGDVAFYDISAERRECIETRWIECNKWSFVTDIKDALSARVVILDVGPGESASVDITKVIEDVMANVEVVIISVRVLVLLAANSDWKMMKLFSFEDDRIEKIEWKVPPHGFSVCRQDLQMFELENGNDVFYGSIPWKIVSDEGNVSTTIEMVNGRVFAAKFTMSNLRVLNFSLEEPKLSQFTAAACQRFKWQTVAWLAETIEKDIGATKHRRQSKRWKSRQRKKL